MRGNVYKLNRRESRVARKWDREGVEMAERRAMVNWQRQMAKAEERERERQEQEAALLRITKRLLGEIEMRTYGCNTCGLGWTGTKLIGCPHCGSPDTHPF